MEGSPELSRPVRYVKGVGEKLSQLLAKKEIRSIEDILYFFPRSYEDRRKIYQVSELIISEQVCVIGRIKRAYPVNYTRSRARAYECIIEDLAQVKKTLVLKWFQKPYVVQKLNPGNLVMVTGVVQAYRGRLQMLHPDMELLGKNVDDEIRAPGIIPIYSQTEGLYQKTIRRIEKQVINEFVGFVKDPLPAEILKKYNYPELCRAIQKLHKWEKPVKPLEAFLRAPLC